MLFRCPTLCAALVAMSATVPAAAQAPTLPAVMNEKADNAQRVLRPLVIGDFDTVDRYAERLSRLTYTEVASWQSSPNADYVKSANAFVKAVQDLRERSARRDLQGATTAYLAIVASCAQCHREVRGARRVSLTAPAPSGVVPPEGRVR